MNYTQKGSDGNSGSTSQRKEEDIFNILVATDIHLGFAEKDPIRAEDTFVTFEEILQIARDNNVDFILLGGDLFHQAKPSPYCIQRCLDLLRKYCLGDRPVAMEFLSDPTRTLTSAIDSSVNYESPNLNISIPVFSIHGNHDDPIGRSRTSALDLVASAGLVNYFGRCNDHENIEILPILMKKGESCLALYGLSHIKDERLARLFLDKKVKMEVPPHQENWFHLLTWHQNRANRGTKNFIPDTALANFIDLVIWGHEHDNRLVPERTASDVFISQPGSSVATSLSQGEAKPKQVGILKIHKKEFVITPVDLRTVRPFLYKEIILKSVSELLEGAATDNIAELTAKVVKDEVEGMIEESRTLGRIGRASELPLIRLIVRYQDDRQLFNTIRFGQSFIGRVANPDDMIKSHILKERSKKTGRTDDFSDIPVAEATARVEDLMANSFRENDPLKALPYTSLNAAVKSYVDTENSDAIPGALERIKIDILRKLEADMPDIEDIDQYLRNVKVSVLQDNLENVLNETNKTNESKTSQKQSAQVKSEDEEIVTIDSDEDIAPRGRGSKKRGGSKAKASAGSSKDKTPKGAKKGKKTTSDEFWW